MSTGDDLSRTFAANANDTPLILVNAIFHFRIACSCINNLHCLHIYESFSPEAEMLLRSHFHVL
jgi:hypothetical protein